MRARSTILLVALGLVLVAGAAQALTLTYDVSLHDDHINAPVKIFATEGATIVFNVENAANSTRAHSFVVGDPPLARTPALAPNSGVRTIQHTFTSTGSYPYYSDVAGDRASGMEGLIVIQKAGGQATQDSKTSPAPGGLFALALAGLIGVAWRARRR